MKTHSLERGQALILIVFGMVGMIALTGVAVDGGMAYSARRTAQNAADNSAMAAALAYARGADSATTAMTSAGTNGFNNDGASNAVAVSEVAATNCPHGATGKVITVQITSHVRTFFAPVLGIRQLTNTVQAVSESCGAFLGPLFDGNAIVALSPTSVGFSAQGTPDWNIVGGGIFSNSGDSYSAGCGGNASVNSPSVTTVGGAQFGCNGTIGSTTTGATQLTYADYSQFLPRTPACNGTATKVNVNGNEYWTAQAGADGSNVAWDGDMVFAPGLYCVTNSPGPFHGAISGTHVTFFITRNDFTLKFNGGGNLTATAPTSGEFAGVLMFSDAELCSTGLLRNQSVDFRGNGTGDITGSVIMPSATVTMYGNSNSRGLHTQVIAYTVDSGGGSLNNINYQSGENYQVWYPAWLTLLK